MSPGNEKVAEWQDVYPHSESSSEAESHVYVTTKEECFDSQLLECVSRRSLRTYNCRTSASCPSHPHSIWKFLRPGIQFDLVLRPML